MKITTTHDHLEGATSKAALQIRSEILAGLEKLNVLIPVNQHEQVLQVITEQLQTEDFKTIVSRSARNVIESVIVEKDSSIAHNYIAKQRETSKPSKQASKAAFSVYLEVKQFTHFWFLKDGKLIDALEQAFANGQVYMQEQLIIGDLRDLEDLDYI